MRVSKTASPGCLLSFRLFVVIQWLGCKAPGRTFTSTTSPWLPRKKAAMPLLAGPPWGPSLVQLWSPVSGKHSKDATLGAGK